MGLDPDARLVPAILAIAIGVSDAAVPVDRILTLTLLLITFFVVEGVV
jgi:hypothetical protein